MNQAAPHPILFRRRTTRVQKCPDSGAERVRPSQTATNSPQITQGRARSPLRAGGAHARATENHPGETRRETTEQKARRVVQEELDKLGWTGPELATRAKGDARKVAIARRLRAETAVTLKWIAAELHMGAWTHVANRLQQPHGNDEANQSQLGLL